MKIFLRSLLIVLTALGLVQGGDAILPPKDLRAEWADLHELKFSHWNIHSFLGWDTPLDGGSKVFFFESERGERFDLMIANPAYWTEQDKKLHCQVFIVIYKNRFYRVNPKSDEEKNLIQKLIKATGLLSGEGKKDPKLLASLAKNLQTREPIFNFKVESSSSRD